MSNNPPPIPESELYEAVRDWARLQATLPDLDGRVTATCISFEVLPYPAEQGAEVSQTAEPIDDGDTGDAGMESPSQADEVAEEKGSGRPSAAPDETMKEIPERQRVANSEPVPVPLPPLFESKLLGAQSADNAAIPEPVSPRIEPWFEHDPLAHALEGDDPAPFLVFETKTPASPGSEQETEPSSPAAREQHPSHVPPGAESQVDEWPPDTESPEKPPSAPDQTETDTQPPPAEQQPRPEHGNHRRYGVLVVILLLAIAGVIWSARNAVDHTSPGGVRPPLGEAPHRPVETPPPPAVKGLIDALYAGDVRSALDQWDSNTDFSILPGSEFLVPQLEHLRSIRNDPLEAVNQGLLECGDQVPPNLCLLRFVALDIFDGTSLGSEQRANIRNRLLNYTRRQARFLHLPLLVAWAADAYGIPATEILTPWLESHQGQLNTDPVSTAVRRNQYTINQLAPEAQQQLSRFLVAHLSNICDTALVPELLPWSAPPAEQVLLRAERAHRGLSDDLPMVLNEVNEQLKALPFALPERGKADLDYKRDMRRSRYLRHALWDLNRTRSNGGRAYFQQLLRLQQKDGQRYNRITLARTTDLIRDLARMVLTLDEVSPRIAERWIKGGFENLFGPIQGSARTSANKRLRILQSFASCWPGNGACTLRTEALPLDSPVAGRDQPAVAVASTADTPPAVSSAYWQDRIYLYQASPSASVPSPIPGLRVSATGDVARALYQAGKNRTPLEPYFAGLHRDWHLAPNVAWGDIAWWIIHQSGWDGTAINYRYRRYGALQAPCETDPANKPQPATCSTLMDKAPEALYQTQLRRLDAVSRALGPVHTVGDALRLWASFYLTPARIDQAIRLARSHAEALVDPKAKDLVRNHWYLTLENTDLALLLLQYHLHLTK